MRLVDIDPILELVKGEHEKVQNCFNEADVYKEPSDIALWGAVLQEVGAFIGLMINAPTVDAVPVRHGKWIQDEFGTMCSACCLYAYNDKFGTPWGSPYCPICGAKMEDEENETL